MKENVRDLLNEQINKELYSAYLYLEFANFFVEKGLNGFANWYTVQAMEEKDHAMLFVKYLQNNAQKVEYETIKKPDNYIKDTLKVLKLAFSHEKQVTESINTIYSAALANNDYRTVQFLDWFIKEQGEEETNADDLVKKMELFGTDPKSLYLLDKELEARTYIAPSLNI